MNINININLLPWREALKEQQKREFLMMLGMSFLAAGGLVFCIHLWINSEISFQNEKNAYLKNEIAQLDQKISEIDALQKEKQQLLAKMDIIQQLQANRPQVVRLFDGIVKTVPDGLFLTNLARTGNNILIDGKAESNTRVSTFMRNIESSSWLKSPVLSLIQADEKEGEKKQWDKLIGFNLQAIEVSNVPALPTNLTDTTTTPPRQGQPVPPPTGQTPGGQPQVQPKPQTTSQTQATQPQTHPTSQTPVTQPQAQPTAGTAGQAPTGTTTK